MEKVYYKIHNKLEYLRVLRLVPSDVRGTWEERDWYWIASRGDLVFIGWENAMEYSRQQWPFEQEGYQLKLVYDFKEYLNQIEEC